MESDQADSRVEEAPVVGDHDCRSRPPSDIELEGIDADEGPHEQGGQPGDPPVEPWPFLQAHPERILLHT